MQNETLAMKRNDDTRSGSRSGTIDFTVEEIGPEVAQLILEDKVRPGAVEDKKAISAYAEVMAAGGWIMNGQPIIFDRDGTLVDGFQRLHAIVRSKATIRTLVARNVRADTLHTIDQHRRRSYTGVLEARGIRGAGSIMRTMSKLIRIENGTLGRENMAISWSRYDRVLDANPELHTAVAISEASQGSSIHSTARPVLAFMALKAGKERKLREFLKATVDDSTYELSSPARMLSLQLTLARENKNSDVDVSLALAILAFNDFCEDKSVSRHYKWKPDFGGVELDDNDKPKDRAQVRKKAPPNLGMPVVEGYPGLAEGHFDFAAEADEFAGRTAEDLIRGIRSDEGREQVRMLTVTPDIARRWLNRFNRSNRKIQANHVEMIKRDILKENWMVNAQPICFTGDPEAAGDDDDARLLNGQHRLMACVQAGIPIEVPIAVNIPEEAFATYDIHAKRTLRKGSGVRVDDRVVAAAARLQWKTDNGIPFETRMSPSATEIKDTIDAHPGMLECFPRARRLDALASAGVMTWFIYHVTSENPDWGNDFLNGLESGDLLEKGNPILSLRNVMIGQRGEKSRVDVLGILESGWTSYKAWREKKAVKDGHDTLEPTLL
ncbi:hypothetical protein LAZ40_09295 [Cereibacter sphaeroides]|uniref:hypothetical protein n=1 Tax=Cereibacter sphaeroides TaxID=1063 RepID=UPI001F454CB5|nr:hypothetical protein [Cereibacter sphaeroides]MCE6959246.1 hypothetical protein [Cereibacter sphaeroides]MCE6972049.1 hypothetical protein [Cereibacter sphaeroides]